MQNLVPMPKGKVTIGVNGGMGNKVILVYQTLQMHVRSHFRKKTLQDVKICDVLNIMCS